MKYLEDYFLGPDEYGFELPKEREDRLDRSHSGKPLSGMMKFAIASWSFVLFIFVAKPLLYVGTIIAALVSVL